MSIGGVVDELAVSDVHAGVRNIFQRRAKKEQISGLQIAPFDLGHAAPSRLQIGIARHVDAAGADQHLREA